MSAATARQAAHRIETDEEGMLRVVESHGAKVRYIVGLSTPKSTAAAWRANAACLHCAREVAHAKDAALVILPDRSHRVAHRGECFVRACVATNPLLTTGAALGRAHAEPSHS